MIILDCILCINTLLRYNQNT